MIEGSSREQFNNAKEETLSPEKKEKLEKYREIKARWDKITAKSSERESGEDMLLTTFEALRTAFQAVRDAVKYSIKGASIEEGVKPEQLLEDPIGGGAEHQQLEREYAQTKEGQVELAHEEALSFNDEFDARASRLEETLKNRENAQKEYEQALINFNELMKEVSN